MKKKKTKAGISSVSASERQRSLTINETRSRSVCFGARHQFGDVVRRMDDVGVGEQQIIRRERRGVFQTFGDRPKFAGPSGRKRPGLNHFSARFRGNRSRPIGTVVIHHESRARGGAMRWLVRQRTLRCAPE